MARKKAVKRTSVIAPKSIREVAVLIRQVGEHQRKLTQIQTDANNQIEKIKKQAMERSLGHQQRIDQLFEGIFIFAQANRDGLTEKGKKKTVSLPTGDILWRLTPPAVSLKGVEKVIKLCQTRGLARFIRVKKEVDREAMLKEPKVAGKIPGVTIRQKEEFVVKPSEVEIEVSKDTAKLKKAVK